MQEIEFTLDSREAAEMIRKNHKDLLRDINRYINQINEINAEHVTERKIAPSDFFLKSEYKDNTGRTLPCYRITLKGCEFIAHKMTGTKGTEFTARYINRFHEMQDIITGQAAEQEIQLPWFIKKLQGDYVVLERDFIQITCVDIRNYKGFYANLTGGLDFNGCGWKCDNEKFRQEHGFDFGDDDCLMYFYLRGVKKAVRLLKNDRRIKMNEAAYEMLVNGIEMIQQKHTGQIPDASSHNETPAGKRESIALIKNSSQGIPIQISISVGNERMSL